MKIKTKFQILFLVILFSIRPFAQSGRLLDNVVTFSKIHQTIVQDYALNPTKDKILYIDGKDKLKYYDLVNSQLIKLIKLRYITYGVPKEWGYRSKHNEEIEIRTKAIFGFSPNNKYFYVLNEFIDSNFKEKNWKSYSYYKTRTDEFGKQGKYTSREATISTLDFYATDNGKYLFSLKDTGFFERDLSSETHSILKGKFIAPRYFSEAGFLWIDSLFVTKSATNEFGGYFFWNLNSKKRIYQPEYFSFDYKLSNDKKYFYYEPTRYSQLSIYFTQNFKESYHSKQSRNHILYYDKIIANKKNEQLIFSSTEFQNNSRKLYKNFIQVLDLSGKKVYDLDTFYYPYFSCKALTNNNEIYVHYKKDSTNYFQIIDFETREIEKLFTKYDLTKEHNFLLSNGPTFSKNGDKMFYEFHNPFCYYDRKKEKFVLLLDTNLYSKAICQNLTFSNKEKLCFFNFESNSKLNEYTTIVHNLNNQKQIEFTGKGVINIGFSEDDSLMFISRNNSCCVYETNSFNKVNSAKFKYDYNYLDNIQFIDNNKKALLLSSKNLLAVFDLQKNKLTYWQKY